MELALSGPATMDRPLTGISVLITDDDADNAEVLSSLLEAYGASVRTASSAATALELLATWAPDVALLDIAMPEVSGYDLIRTLRLLPAMAGVPILAVTGHSSQLDVARARSAGFDAHVAKPIDVSMLVALILEVSSERAFHEASG